MNKMIDRENGMQRPSLEATAGLMEGAVLFAGSAATRPDLLTPELTRTVVSLIQQANADGSLRVVVFESARRISATTERGFHSSDAEMDQILRILNSDV